MVSLPLSTFAATTFREATIKFVDILTKSLVPLLFSIALALFIWGIADFIRSADNPEQRKVGKQRIVWGIIGLLAMVGYISLVGFVTNSFFNGSPGLPQLKGIN